MTDSRPDEPRFATIIPSLPSLLAWAEEVKDEPLTSEEVTALAGDAPSMTLPQSIARLLLDSRDQPDVDPEEAWEQWSYLRRVIGEQGRTPAQYFASPKDQLDKELIVLRQICLAAGMASPEVVDHQLGVLVQVLDSYLTMVTTALG